MIIQNKFLIASLAVNLIFLVAIGWMLLDMGVLKAEIQIKDIQAQLLQNTNNINQVINFINQQIQPKK